jgi:hypothetical protein
MKKAKRQSPPCIRYKACDGGEYFLDGQFIREATARWYWKNKSAFFFPFAAQRMKEIDMADALN